MKKSPSGKPSAVWTQLRSAKYFHLKSDALGVDYSDYQTLQVPVPEGVMRPDTTEPDVCMIEVTDQEMETGLITVELSADGL